MNFNKERKNRMVEERRVEPTFSTHSATLDLADVDKTVESLKMEVSLINRFMKCTNLIIILSNL